MSSKKKKVYHVQLDIKILTQVTVPATSLQEALEYAKENVRIGDAVEILGDHIDSEMNITGIFE